MFTERQAGPGSGEERLRWFLQGRLMTLDKGRRHSFIMLAKQQALCWSVFLAVAIIGPTTYAKDSDTPVPESELQAKTAYCENCHGVSARGFHGFYPIPRLAGQQAEYLENQLQAFIERRRANNIMFNVSHVLSPQMLDALAENF